jgi:hypothetical protein
LSIPRPLSSASSDPHHPLLSLPYERTRPSNSHREQTRIDTTTGHILAITVPNNDSGCFTSQPSSLRLLRAHPSLTCISVIPANIHPHVEIDETVNIFLCIPILAAMFNDIASCEFRRADGVSERNSGGVRRVGLHQHGQWFPSLMQHNLLTDDGSFSIRRLFCQRGAKRGEWSIQLSWNGDDDELEQTCSLSYSPP